MLKFEYVELWLVGEGDFFLVLCDLISELNLYKQVKFFGYLNLEEFRSIILQVYLGLNFLENRGLSYYYLFVNKSFDYI